MAIVNSFEFNCETPNDAERTLQLTQSRANIAFGMPEHTAPDASAYIDVANRQRLEAFLRELEANEDPENVQEMPTRNDFAGLITLAILQKTELAHDVSPGMVLDTARRVGPEFDDPNGPLAIERLDVAGDYFDEHPGLQGTNPALATLSSWLEHLLARAGQHANAGVIYQANAEFCRQVWATSLTVLEDVDRIKLH